MYVCLSEYLVLYIYVYVVFQKRENVYIYITLFKCHLQNNNYKCDIDVKVFIIYQKNNVIDNYKLIVVINRHLL